MPSYIPNADALCKDWLVNFAARITATPSTFGLTAAEALTIQNAVNAFVAAYLEAVEPATRTSATIADKDALKAAALGVCRPYAQLIRRNAGVSNESKTNLGLTLVDVNPTKIEAPTSSPVLSIIGATPLQHTLRFVDQNTPTTRAKPAGVIGMELFAQPSSTVITDPTAIKYKGHVTRNPVAVDFDLADVGKPCYYAARWVTRRGLTGPWSNIVSFVVAN